MLFLRSIRGVKFLRYANSYFSDIREFSFDTLQLKTNLSMLAVPSTKVPTDSKLLHSSVRPLPAKQTSAELEDLKFFGPAVKQELLTEEGYVTDACNWFSKVYDYNLTNGKQIRGTTVVKTYKLLSKDVTNDQLKLACILGWCVEMLQAFLLICDDIMDQSVTRRGRLCWYKQPEVGLIGINDALFLQSGIYKLLKKHFGDKNFYTDIVDEFLLATHKTIYGQCLDMLSCPQSEKSRFNNFSMEYYFSIVKHKTSFYTFYLPICLAMHLSRTFTFEEFDLMRQVSEKLGLLFQMQDDFLDIYGNPEITGKIGTDIQDGKCTWFAATFMENANELDKNAFMKYYGIYDEEMKSKVVSLYGNALLEEKYKMAESDLFNNINNFIQSSLKTYALQEISNHLLKIIYKRQN